MCAHEERLCHIARRGWLDLELGKDPRRIEGIAVFAPLVGLGIYQVDPPRADQGQVSRLQRKDSECPARPFIEDLIPLAARRENNSSPLPRTKQLRRLEPALDVVESQ